MKKIITILLIMSMLSPPMTVQAEDEFPIDKIPQEAWDAARKVAQEQCLPPEWYIATGIAETGLNPKAVGDHGNSIGTCQVQPRWAKANMDKYGYTVDDLFDMEKNFRVAGDIYLEHLEKYRYPDLCEMKFNGSSDAEYRFETGNPTNYAIRKKNLICQLQKGQ